jgi:hypothetical protein
MSWITSGFKASEAFAALEWDGILEPGRDFGGDGFTNVTAEIEC